MCDNILTSISVNMNIFYKTLSSIAVQKSIWGFQKIPDFQIQKKSGFFKS